MTVPIKNPRKLIEVALPLDAINIAAAREKSIRHGHPSTLHLWWARRPLAAARAVIFAQMVNDPGYERNLGRGMNKEKAAAERERLFRILEKLVLWENSNDENVLAQAREEIWKSWRETCALNRSHADAATLFNPNELPAFHDPFSGGGTLPLEAQRLGLVSYASDLNPVAVTINKAMLELPSRFRDRHPVGPVRATERQARLSEEWIGTQGFAEDVRRYGAWMHEEAEKRLRPYYPDAVITQSAVNERPNLAPMLGKSVPVIAWLWARTVCSPSPAFADCEVPLASNFMLSTKPGGEAYVELVCDNREFSFRIHTGAPADRVKASKGTRANNRGHFLCPFSGAPIAPEYIKAQGKAGRIGARLMAIVAELPRSRLYLSPTPEHEQSAANVPATWRPELEMHAQALGFRVPPYGFKTYGDLFTERQLLTLNTLSDLAVEARDRVFDDAKHAGFSKDDRGLEDNGIGARAYAETISLYLAIFVSRMVNLNNAFCQWRNDPAKQHVGHMFSRQAVSMIWDFAEANPLGGSAGGFEKTFEFVPKVFPFLPAKPQGFAIQADAATQTISTGKVVSSDPPYFDNIGYADLSDFFYVWLRRCARETLPRLLSTMGVPKAEELVATPFRHGGKVSAEQFFLSGMTKAMHSLADSAHPAFPVTIYYAFKQSDTDADSGTSNTGWETFLEAVLRAGFSITGTWPMRTELSNRIRGTGSNALASSIVLVCRKRNADSTTVSRREFLRELNAALPEALAEMTRGGENSPVAPVDLSQAIIGPGMAIFSQYAAVLEADGSPMSVGAALTLINRFLAEDDFDHETQFCLHWFDGYGWGAGNYGDADVLARAKGTSVAGIADAGVVESGGGNVRLLRYAEYPDDWSPSKDNRTPIWEALHHMIRALQNHGEAGAGKLLADMPARAEPIRALAYRLYTLCERKGWAEDARAYNELITSWTGIEGASQEIGHIGTQVKLDI